MEEKQLELNKIIKKKKIYQLLLIVLVIGLLLVAYSVYPKEHETCELDDEVEPHQAYNSKYESFEGNKVKGSNEE